ncbi:MAG: shikimate dehydrogenase [bacterium]|nr:shikimate dehydrogenase [bacterium]
MNLAIFGSPVGHSLSPAMHRAAFANAGIEGDYTAHDVDHDGFLTGVVSIRNGGLDGANVTMPHKIVAYDVCDQISLPAARAGAVNTLSMQEGLLFGDNTDILGIRSAWEVGCLPIDLPVVILGAGGASAAAQVALEGHELYVVARRPEVAQTMVERVAVGAQVIAWGDPIPGGVLVNATSLGMGGETLPEYLLESAAGLLDMSYGDAETPSVAAIRNVGLPVADGLDMLVGQAVGSFAIWTGVDVDSSVFRSAALAELERRT